MGTGCSISLSVVYDGQFWVGLFERQERGAYAVARVVFGAEPADAEVLDLVCRRFASVRFSRSLAGNEAKKTPLAANPKRRKREAARALRGNASKPGTKAQRALAAERDLRVQEAQDRRRAVRAEEGEAAFVRRQAKHKAKHRGH